MINLLPQSEKKKLLGEYRLHLAVVLLWVILGLELCAGVLFAPSYYMINGTTKTLALELAAKKAVAPSGEEGAQQKLALIKSEIAMLKPSVVSEALPSHVLTQILSQKPAGIGLNSYAYAYNAGTVLVQFTGIAATREDLLEFQRNLKENPRLSDVRYAQSFITRKTNIDFQLTVTFK